MEQKILVPLDGSQSSIRALDVAVNLARTLHARIVLAYVIDDAKAARLTFGEPALIDGAYDALRDDGERYLAEALARVASLVPKTTKILAYGNPADEINKMAKQVNATMIVMGSHGRTGLQHALMGSVAEGVIRNAAVPVVVVPGERVRAIDTERVSA
jgi:nucleotide-binding universal stress UspA family protein